MIDMFYIYDIYIYIIQYIYMIYIEYELKRFTLKRATNALPVHFSQPSAKHYGFVLSFSSDLGWDL